MMSFYERHWIHVILRLWKLLFSSTKLFLLVPTSSSIILFNMVNLFCLCLFSRVSHLQTNIVVTLMSLLQLWKQNLAALRWILSFHGGWSDQCFIACGFNHFWAKPIMFLCSHCNLLFPCCSKLSTSIALRSLERMFLENRNWL